MAGSEKWSAGWRRSGDEREPKHVFRLLTNVEEGHRGSVSSNGGLKVPSIMPACVTRNSLWR